MSDDSPVRPDELWPALPYAQWHDTLDTLHLWLQIVGKIRLKQEPLVNHWWNVPLYVSARGLSTHVMPYRDRRTFEIRFDFIDHELFIQECNGGTVSFELEPMSVALFYRKLMDALACVGIEVSIYTKPSEIADGIPFAADNTHKSYDRDYVHRFWRVLVQADRLFKVFRARFLGKVSPVHFFWGAPDLAITRFSGRTAPEHPGGIPGMPGWVTREAYSHEVSSAGFWAGNANVDACFYSYAYPEPPGFAQSRVQPEAAFYHAQLHEFMLPYESARTSNDPDAAVLAFLESTYEAAATLGNWDRQALER